MATLPNWDYRIRVRGTGRHNSALAVKATGAGKHERAICIVERFINRSLKRPFASSLIAKSIECLGTFRAVLPHLVAGGDCDGEPWMIVTAATSQATKTPGQQERKRQEVLLWRN